MFASLLGRDGGEIGGLRCPGRGASTSETLQEGIEWVGTVSVSWHS